MYDSPYHEVLSEFKSSGSVSSSLSYVGMSSGKTLLMVAAMEGDYIACSMLVKLGVDLNAQDSVGFTALMYAVRDGHEEIVELLLRSGCNPSLASTSGYSPMICAAQNGFTSIVLLLSMFSSVNDQDEDGMTPLMCACINNHISTVPMLLQLGADPSLMNKVGNTAIDFALLHNNVEIVHCFLQNKIPIMCHVGGDEVPALYIAALQKQYPICAVLLSNESSFDSLIHFLLMSPNHVVQDVILSCLVEIEYSLPEDSCFPIRHVLDGWLNTFCQLVAAAFSDGIKLPVSLSSLVEIAVWCIRCNKVISHGDLHHLAFFWNFVDNTVVAMSSDLKRQSSVAGDAPDEMNPANKLLKEYDVLLNMNVLTHRQIRLLFSMMELYCAGSCAFYFDSKSGCCHCYSISDRLFFLLKSNGTFFRELAVSHSSLFHHMPFFYAAARNFVY